MRGMILGALAGFAITVGILLSLEMLGVLRDVGSMWSMLIGFSVSIVLVNLGLLIGGLLDD